MNLSNAAFDLAAARAEQERDAGVADAGIALKQTGSTVCIACGEPISEERRLAAPFARRCIDCQTLHEAEKKSR
jgi:phage/conjugal plasmid C-4 type zinc finger TraR family protein